MDATMRKVGVGGHVNGYDVLIVGDGLYVGNDSADDGRGRVWRHPVPDYRTKIGRLAARPGFRLGWGRFPDGAEVLYLYDADDNGFGYAFNVTDPELSEWGYAPFTRT